MQQLHYTSETKGLWARFITQLIAGWLFAYFGGAMGISILSSFITIPVVLSVIYLLGFVVVTLLVFRDIPRHWDNKVTIDLDRESIKISSKRERSEQQSILDFDGREIGFADIDYYTTKNYESPVFSSYYLVTLFVGLEKVKLISFKSANEFTEFVGVLNKKAGLKLK